MPPLPSNFAPSRNTVLFLAFGLLASHPLLAFDAFRPQSGHVLNGEGAVNQAMAGVATAMPVDGAGTLLWNSAGIAALPSNSMAFHMELLSPDLRMTSSISSPGPMSGTTASDSPISPIPVFALIYHIPDTDWTFGMGAAGIGGFGVDYPSSSSNPLLMPPPNGFGDIYSQFQMLQLSPTLAYKIDNNWHVGFAPNVNQAQLSVSPGSFASPNDPDGIPGNGDESYPTISHAATAWGLGGQLGVFYRGDGDWDFGASYKSKQSFQSFKFNSTDAAGAHRSLSFDLDFPSILSIGTAYRGWNEWLVGMDLRWIDYENTDGFQSAGFASDGSVTGFGWDSILLFSVGAEYAMREDLYLRLGYAFNQNPVPDKNTAFNIPAPAIIQHHGSIGLSWQIADAWFFDMAYRRGFENAISGPMVSPGMGNVPGTEVESRMSTQSLIFGFRVDF